MEPWAMNPNIMEIIFGDYVGAHFLQIIIGCMALIVAPKITWKDAIKSIIFIFLMMAYIAIIYWMTNITMQTTGIAEGDWRKGGEYNIVPTVLNMNNQSIHAIRFVGWMIFIVAQLILTYIIILCQKADKKYCNKFPEGFIYKYTKPFFTQSSKKALKLILNNLLLNIEILRLHEL
ncbi:hypothetical protein C4B24_02370 [Mycoplasma marinum]|uniref:Uncharacterized protein n=2 Tax=Mycoplasma marinum TaxID=1937190 RepID=A0A4R0XL55_9MOLU|nr:hypothetical protein C4B24_02370 [Mycoplasma marinum]